ncbi:hypothetical protein GH714_023713 [Hevea brasiliensis]|uniref:RIN4 pathogenic type III effector avirulence factor Avr cleavage site domain-containing protein n=1 Tax=Hevea brasiliensis TaxID=3981 RepID=A0A6A6MMA9_HEVBR|nr:hypothetical protein GH714_023713 [Hevea brasiliensis]
MSRWVGKWQRFGSSSCLEVRPLALPEYAVVQFLHDKGLPLPKFGEWDVSNPASAEGFTVIFNKARDKKKTKNAPAKVMSPRRNDAVHKNNDSYQNSPKSFILHAVEMALLWLNHSVIPSSECAWRPSGASS